MPRKCFETVIIASGKLTKTQYNEFVEKYKKIIIELEEGTIVYKVEKLGKKKLAYEIKGMKEAWYTIIRFKTEPEKLGELERIYRIDDKIIKFLTIRIDEETEDITEYVSSSPIEEDTPAGSNVKSEQSSSGSTTDCWDKVFNLEGVS